METNRLQQKHDFWRKMYKPLHRTPRTNTDTVNKQVDNITDFGFKRNQLPFNGRIIRHIQIIRFNFDRNLDDTALIKKNNKGNELLNKFHTTTKENIIRQNIYLKENKPFSAFLAADNEWHLRTLPYIRDARILVDTIPGCTDSIDIKVYTKDLFSVELETSRFDNRKQRLRLSDVNLMGWGQTVSIAANRDQERSPKTGYTFLYSKNNLFGSYLNFQSIYTNTANNLVNGIANEINRTLTLSLPLVSQFKKFAGELTLESGKTDNNYERPSEEYDQAKYHYTHFDAWMGINLGTKKLLTNHLQSRHFLSWRFNQYRFQSRPIQLENIFNRRYDNRRAALVQYTNFKQSFYRTQYLHGFGLTEDVPYGYNISVIGGWTQEQYINRPYVGLDANKYFITQTGNIYQFFGRAGLYYHHGFQDVNILAGTSIASKLFYIGSWKFRTLTRLSYSEIINPFISDLLRIDNSEFGLQRYGMDSTIGTRRITFQNESYFFAPFRLLNFQFSPFSTIETSFLTPKKGELDRTAMYTGLGGGVRSRNENFVFGTTELRFIYFPKNVPNLNRFKIGLKANLRFRYNTRYVQAPDIVQMNGDSQNLIN